MTLAVLAVAAGLALLLWSGDRFIAGSAAVAQRLGLPPLLIGMVIVGFGTSAPEMIVSGLAAYQNAPGIALGNAYGSNLTNIALILGLTALIHPVAVHSTVLRKELPILTAVSLLAAVQLWDGVVSRLDAGVLLTIFAFLLAWTVRQGLRGRDDALAAEVQQGLQHRPLPFGRAIIWMAVGLVLLIVSSRLLVWGAVEVARGFGVSDLIIGLTVVAVGTSLPELASSIIAVRRGEHDLALGNVLGSNLFNTLAVVGLAGLIRPLSAAPEVLSRDLVVMVALTLLLFALGFGVGGPGRINRLEGLGLLAAFIAYNLWLIAGAVA
jgi:cation:H+ antiporter